MKVQGSSAIAHIDYYPDELLLRIITKQRAALYYTGVPPTVHDEFLAAASKGSFYNSRIKGHFKRLEDGEVLSFRLMKLYEKLSATAASERDMKDQLMKGGEWWQAFFHQGLGLGADSAAYKLLGVLADQEVAERLIEELGQDWRERLVSFKQTEGIRIISNRIPLDPEKLSMERYGRPVCQLNQGEASELIDDLKRIAKLPVG